MTPTHMLSRVQALTARPQGEQISYKNYINIQLLPNDDFVVVVIIIIAGDVFWSQRAFCQRCVAFEGIGYVNNCLVNLMATDLRLELDFL